MLATYLGVLFALVAILVLVALAGRAVRSLGVGGTGGAQAPLAVLHRAALGPRQGVALVRVGSRAIVVSLGEGGVRPLASLDADELAALEQAPQREVTATGGGAAFRQALTRSLGLGRVVLFAALLGAAGATAQAQATPPASTPSTTNAAPPATAQAAPRPNATPGAAATAGNPAARPANPVATGAAVVERLAPRMDLRVGDERGDGLRLNGTIGIVVMLGLMSLLPTLVLMTTGFTRILVVLYFLRQALGTQTSPPAPLIAGLALILTGFVMAPTFSRVNADALTPWLDGRIAQVEMLERGAVPLREFMLRQTRPADVRRMVRLSRQPAVAGQQVPFITLMAAFTISELRTAFAIGFALFLPFIVIDVVVASVLMSLGMFMLPPTMIALPFKLLLFVLVDGWGLMATSLVSGFR